MSKRSTDLLAELAARARDLASAVTAEANLRSGPEGQLAGRLDEAREDALFAMDDYKLADGKSLLDKAAGEVGVEDLYNTTQVTWGPNLMQGGSAKRMREQYSAYRETGENPEKERASADARLEAAALKGADDSLPKHRAAATAPTPEGRDSEAKAAVQIEKDLFAFRNMRAADASNPNRDPSFPPLPSGKLGDRVLTHVTNDSLYHNTAHTKDQNFQESQEPSKFSGHVVDKEGKLFLKVREYEKAMLADQALGSAAQKTADARQAFEAASIKFQGAIKDSGLQARQGDQLFDIDAPNHYSKLKLDNPAEVQNFADLASQKSSRLEALQASQLGASTAIPGGNSNASHAPTSSAPIEKRTATEAPVNSPKPEASGAAKALRGQEGNRRGEFMEAIEAAGAKPAAAVQGPQRARENEFMEAIEAQSSQGALPAAAIGTDSSTQRPTLGTMADGRPTNLAEALARRRAATASLEARVQQGPVQAERSAATTGDLHRASVAQSSSSSERAARLKPLGAGVSSAATVQTASEMSDAPREERSAAPVSAAAARHQDRIAARAAQTQSAPKASERNFGFAEMAQAIPDPAARAQSQAKDTGLTR